jgi:small subunit ribosomal protein S1
MHMAQDFLTLVEEYSVDFPELGDVIEGKIVATGRNEVRIGLPGLNAGVVRGRELYKESSEYSNLNVGDEVEATVIDLENENGEIELSFRYAGHQKAWQKILDLKEEGTVVKAKIIDANKGGLMVRVDHIVGFLPVSQLIPEHYPRVQGGDKTKILDRLKSYIGQEFDVKVLDADANDEKLILSEKAAWEERQQSVISQYNVKDIITGRVTAVTDFGAFIEFGENLEGLVHISEIAWQRIDDPRDLVKVGEEIKAEIIKIENSKIFLSMKSLIDDPWKGITDKYNVGDTVTGKVLKINPFGLFVELDQDIHGLAHISELSDKQVNDPHEIAQVGDEMKFMILTIEPKNHRLGLSIKALKKGAKPAAQKEAPAKEAEEAAE